MRARWHWAIPAGAILCLLAPILAYLGAMGATYLGWTWMAKMAGVRGWRMGLLTLRLASERGTAPLHSPAA